MMWSFCESASTFLNARVNFQLGRSCYYLDTLGAPTGTGTGTAHSFSKTGALANPVLGETALLDALNAWVGSNLPPSGSAYSYSVWDKDVFPELIDLPSLAAASGVWDGSTASGFAGGTGTKSDPYLISTGAQLSYLAYVVNTDQSDPNGGDFNSAVKYYALTNNIRLNDTSNWTNWGSSAPANRWTPIGSNSTTSTGFVANFDGAGFSVFGAYISASSDYQGLFGYVDGGSISNTGLEQSYIGSNGDHVGGIVGWINGGSVTNCFNKGTVSGSNYVGGIVGWINGGSVTNCFNKGTVSGMNDCVGGIIGYLQNSSAVTNCYNTGAPRGNNSIGGIAGFAQDNGSVTNCYNAAPVTGMNDCVGGIIGSLQNSAVTNCYNTGAVGGNNSIGGIVGDASGSDIGFCYYSNQASRGIGNGIDTPTMSSFDSAGGLASLVNVGGIPQSRLIGALTVWVENNNSGPNYLFYEPATTSSGILYRFVQQESYEITVTVMPEGTANVSYYGAVGHGHDTSVTIVPESGWQIQSVTDNGLDVTSSLVGDTYQINNAASDHHLMVIMEPASGNVAIEVAIVGDGSVSWSYSNGSGTLTGTGGNLSVPIGSDISFTAVDGTDVFSRWTGDTLSLENRIDFTVSGSGASVTAVFVPGPADGGCSLTVNIDGTGSVDIGMGAGTGVYTVTSNTTIPVEIGDAVYLTAAGSGSDIFSRWTGDMPSLDNTKSFTVAGSSVSTAVFVSGPAADGGYSLTVEITGMGTVTVTINGNAYPVEKTSTAIPVEYEASIVFKADPESGYVFAYWIINRDDTNKITGTPYPSSGTIRINGDMYIEAVFVPSSTQYTINASAQGMGGIITPEGYVTVNLNEDQTFTFTPSRDWHIVAVIVDGERYVWTETNYTFYNVVSDHTIVAVFEGDPYIYAEAGDNGSITPEGNVSVNAGSDVTFTIKADEYYTVDTVAINSMPGVLVPVADRQWTYTFNSVVDNSNSIVVTFRIDDTIAYALTVTAGIGGNVDVTRADGSLITVWGGTTGVIPVPIGTDITVHADPSSAYFFTYWTISRSADPTTEHPAASEYTFTVDQNMDVSTVFTPSILNVHTLNVSSTAGGGVSWYYMDNGNEVTGGTGTFNIPNGSDVFFEAASEPYHVFSRWTGDMISLDKNPDFILSGLVPRTYSVNAVFVPDTSAVTVNIDGTGSVAVTINSVTYTISTGTVLPVEVSDAVSLTATGTGGDIFSRWTGDVISSGSTISFMVAGSSVLTAVFVPDPAKGGYELTVNIDGTGSVAVTINSVTYTISTGTVLPVKVSDAVSLTAAGTGNHVFSRWTGDMQSLDSNISFMVAGSSVSTAVFVSGPADGGYSLTVDITGTGTVGVTINGDVYSVISNTMIPVEPGDSVVFKELPVAGQTLAYWVVNGDNTNKITDVPYPSSGTIRINGDMDIEAVFVPSSTQYTINASAQGIGGTITPDGYVTVDFRNDQTFTFTPSADWHIVAVIVDGERTVWTEASYTFYSVVSDHTIVAVFEGDPYIYAEAGDNGSITPEGNVSVVNAGSDVTFTINADEYYTVDTATINGAPGALIPVADRQWSYTFSNVVDNSNSILVTFRIDDTIAYALTVTAGAGGNIDVTRADDGMMITVWAGTTVVIPVPYGQDPSGADYLGLIHISADPSPEYWFTYWTIYKTAELTTEHPAASEYTFTVDQNMDVSTVFTPSILNVHTLNVSSTAGGGVSWYYMNNGDKVTGGIGVFSIPNGSDVFFEATSGPDHVFSRWTGDMSSPNENMDLILSGLVPRTYSVNAVFVPDTVQDHGLTCIWWILLVAIMIALSLTVLVVWHRHKNDS